MSNFYLVLCLSLIFDIQNPILLLQKILQLKQIKTETGLNWGK